MRAAIRAEWGQLRASFDLRSVTIFVVAGLALCVYHYHHLAELVVGVVARRYHSGDVQGFARCTAWNVSAYVPLVLLPQAALLAIRPFARTPAPESGWGLGNWRVGAPITLGFVAIALVCAAVAARNPDFRDAYPLCREARHSLPRLLGWDLSFALYFVAWESFYRGFLTLGLERALGPWAIFVQMLPFVVAHFDKPPLEAASSVFGGVALGYLALRTRSFWYGALIHAAMAISVDALVTWQVGFR